ncbi:MAG TPA: DUF389 domain-containing protein [Cytophagaceae bacterium]
MRQVIIDTPASNSERVEKIAEANHAKLESKTNEEARVIFSFFFEDSYVGKFLHGIQYLEDTKVSLSFYPMVQFQAPFIKDNLIADVIREKSGVDAYLNTWLSLGTYKSFLSYSLVAAIVSWIAIYTNNIFLLIGGILTAPFAVAALSTAMGAVSGDINLIKQGVGRYILALSTGFLVSVFLTGLFPTLVFPSIMVQVSQLSLFTMVLPLIAGFTGAVGLINAERNNLVPQAAYGLLISVSLAPQSVFLGISLITRETDAVLNALFILLTQLVFIHLSASLVFRYYVNIIAKDLALSTRAGKAFGKSIAIAGIVAVGLMIWQSTSKPELQQSGIESEIASIIKETTDSIPQIDLVEASVKFTRSKDKDIKPVLCEIYIVKLEQYFNPNDFTEYTNLLIQTRLKEAVKERIKSKNLKVHPIFKIEFVSS